MIEPQIRDETEINKCSCGAIISKNQKWCKDCKLLAYNLIPNGSKFQKSKENNNH